MVRQILLEPEHSPDFIILD